MGYDGMTKKRKKNIPLPFLSKLASDPTVIGAAQYTGAADLSRKAQRYISGKRKTNPLKTSSQYGLMQAVASGTARVKGISQAVAEKLIHETPAGVRSKFAKQLAKIRKHNSHYDIFMGDNAQHNYNPENEEEEAARVSEEWHGRKAKDVNEIDEVESYDEVGAELADLEELGVLQPSGEITIRFKFNRPKLISDIRKENLEIVGGDQEIEVEGDKVETPIGYVYCIVYETDKHHLEGSNGYPESYEHFFGEEFYKDQGYSIDDFRNSDDFWETVKTEGVVDEAIDEGYLPILTYNQRDKKMKLVGGKYEIKDVGISN